MNNISLALVVFASCAVESHGWGGNSAYANNRVPMDSIDTLTFFNGRQTNSRRVSAVPQLKCVGGDAQYQAQSNVNVVQCRKVGTGYGNNIQWKCEAELPVEYRLGETTVSCEGYDHSNDPFVLEGSCGLEYTLHKTGMTSPAHNNAYHNNHHQYGNQHYAGNRYNGHRNGLGWMGYLVVGALGFMLLGSSGLAYGAIAYIASSMFGLSMTSLLVLGCLMWFLFPKKTHHNAPSGFSSWFGGPSFSGWGNSNGYGWGSNYGNYGGGYGSGMGNFFSGMAAGGLASSFMNGGRRSPQHYHSYNTPSSSSWSGTSSSNSGSGSRTTHTSKGYGGTRNR